MTRWSRIVTGSVVIALAWSVGWGTFVQGQPVHTALRSLADRYLALPDPGDAPDLVGLEARLEILPALLSIDEAELDQDDRIDRQLLAAMMRRDLYWLLGEDADAAPPLPGYLYRCILDPDRGREAVLARLPRDIDTMIRALGRDGRSLGERPDGRRRRLQLLERILTGRFPAVVAHAGPYRGEIARAVARLKQRVQAIRAQGKPRADRAAGDLEPWPDGVGETRFRFLLCRYHLVPLDPDSVVEIGQRMARRTEAELRNLASRMDPGRTWQELAKDLQNDHPAPGELPGFGQHVVEDAIRFVEANAILTLSAAARRIRVRPWRGERSYPFGAYLRATEPGGVARVMVPDLARAGISEAMRRQRLRENNVSWTRVVMVHEAVPGHHVQHVVAAANPDPVRRRYYSDVTGEGWAMYSEELMASHGFYPDQETRLAQLKMRYWRSLPGHPRRGAPLPRHEARRGRASAPGTGRPEPRGGQSRGATLSAKSHAALQLHPGLSHDPGTPGRGSSPTRFCV